MKYLDDIVVVDFSSRLPGPLATKLLAAQGARVYKIESASNPDPFNEPDLHKISPAFKSWYKQLNENKKIVTLDFSDEQKLKTYLSLADVILIPDNRFFNSLKELDDAKVVIKIAAGEGKYKSLHDLNALALCETFHLHLQDSFKPPYLPFAGINFGVYISQFICAALVKAFKSGESIKSTVTLKDATLSVFNTFNSESFTQSPYQLHNGLLPSYSLYKTRDDKHVALAAVEEKYWNKFSEAFQLGLSPDDRFNTSRDIFEKIENKFASLTSNEISNIIENDDFCLTLIN